MTWLSRTTKRHWYVTLISRCSMFSSSIWTGQSPTANGTTRSSKSGRRGAGRDHQRIRLRDGRRNLRGRYRGSGRDYRAVARPDRRPCITRKEQRLRRQRDRRHQPGNYRGACQLDPGCWYREGEDSLGVDLRVQTRRLRDVLRTQPGFWTPGRTWRGNGSHRGTVHRRAWNSANDAYLPHRWYGIASL